MPTNLWTRVMLFFSSYAPLFFILAVRVWFVNQTAGVILFVVACVSIVRLILFLRTVQRLSAHNVTISHVQVRDAEMTSYIVSYLLPFLPPSLVDPANVISLGILLLVIAIIYVHSNLIHINPILNLLGYHLFEVETDDGKVNALICKQVYVKTEVKMDVISLGDYIIMEKKT